MKRFCCICCEDKDITLFSKAYGADGLRTCCKACRSARESELKRLRRIKKKILYFSGFHNLPPPPEKTLYTPRGGRGGRTPKPPKPSQTPPPPTPFLPPPDFTVVLE